MWPPINQKNTHRRTPRRDMEPIEAVARNPCAYFDEDVHEWKYTHPPPTINCPQILNQLEKPLEI